MTPSQEYRRTDHRVPEPLLKGLDARVHGVVGFYRRRPGVPKRLRQEAEEIDALAARLGALPDHELHDKLMACREGFRRGLNAMEPSLLMEALAAIREAAARKLGLRPFVVQLMGALALHRDYLAEMATGEGKTLTAGLAGVLAGWTHRPCHIVTVNDYLVQRDTEWLRPLYQFCGVRVGCVTAMMNPLERQKGYQCDVTYTTSKELLADFLRDRLRLGTLQHPTRRLIRQLLKPQRPARDGLVMRGLGTVIVDEADSVLIDEAVTPLIISAKRRNEVFRHASEKAHQIVGALERDRHYRVNLRYKEIELTPEGTKALAEACSGMPGIWQGPHRREELIKQALVAREFFVRDKQYIIDNDKIVIVDEFTGRPMPQRTWREGLHQAVEAKEGLDISDPTETVSRLSFQRFFRCFYKISGMTGTAREASGELWQIYRLPVITLPTNRPCIRETWPDRIFEREDRKWEAIVDEIVRLHAVGRPVLIGTRSVKASEKLATMLKERQLTFNLLNAVRLKEEAQTIALAGQRGRITIATNMAGRGTDISLGDGVPELGGLHVIASERHESGRVDRQLFGRAARQGNPGSCQAFVSCEDELVQRHLPLALQKVLRRTVAHPIPGNEMLAKRLFGLAQSRAQAQAFAQRKSVLKTDTWMEDALSFAGGGDL